MLKGRKKDTSVYYRSQLLYFVHLYAYLHGNHSTLQSNPKPNPNRKAKIPKYPFLLRRANISFVYIHTENKRKKEWKYVLQCVGFDNFLPWDPPLLSNEGVGEYFRNCRYKIVSVLVCGSSDFFFIHLLIQCLSDPHELSIVSFGISIWYTIWSHWALNVLQYRIHVGAFVSIRHQSIATLLLMHNLSTITPTTMHIQDIAKNIFISFLFICHESRLISDLNEPECHWIPSNNSKKDEVKICVQTIKRVQEKIGFVRIEA